MAVDVTADTHVHTSLCRHAVGTMEEYVESAAARGLRSVTFLEHLEESIVSGYRTWLREEDFDAYFDEGRRLQQRYRDRIRVELGVEVGYNPDCAGVIRERLGRRDWDRIGVSCHFFRIPGRDEHVNLLSGRRRNVAAIERYGAGKLLDRYLATMAEAIGQVPARVLCHLDAGLRHQPGLRYEDRHWRRVEELLGEVRRAGLELEINTSGFSQRGEQYPRTGIIAMARDRSIPFTVGSDAHHPAEVGRHFDRVPALLEATGSPAASPRSSAAPH